MIVLAAVLALAGGDDPSIVPIPIGPGPRFRPAAIVRSGEPVGPFTCGPPGKSFRVHIELFAERRSIVVPPGIGVASSGCVYPARTRGRLGVVEVAVGSRLTLGDVFRIWGRGSGSGRCSRSRRLAGAGLRRGQAVPRPGGEVPLKPGAQIVVELGPYIPPHKTFLFPPREEGQ